jgi:hypothetical protein
MNRCFIHADMTHFRVTSFQMYTYSVEGLFCVPGRCRHTAANLFSRLHVQGGVETPGAGNKISGLETAHDVPVGNN